jgi:hypothetical protein
MTLTGPQQPKQENDMTDDLRAPMKLAMWEEAKGKLRALVALQGSYFGGDTHQTKKWEDAEAAVNQFIEDFEGNGLQE